MTNRLKRMIDLLTIVEDEPTSWRIELAKGKYAMPKTIKAAIKMGKRIKKYGNDNDKP